MKFGGKDVEVGGRLVRIGHCQPRSLNSEGSGGAAVSCWRVGCNEIDR